MTVSMALTIESTSDTSIRSPKPVRSLPRREARIPMQAFNPATMSAIAVPVRVGGESGQPDTLIKPPIAWPMMSYPGRSL